ncbi:excalibur calcium-binding domain-containing protein [Halomonas aquamarina]|uniref:Excalibur calcium-binding domain-containing protein n=2 Tax=Vreelandella aquamarina TaxID=77097 RepID=A0ACC5VSM3_9GAMM|nr:excalibur calcium-binding domain-containing protein [Halomonas aquamarina]
MPDSITEFSCDTRKTCGQMSSCDEAMFHLLQCGNGRLDGDNDGVPCESICR